MIDTELVYTANNSLKFQFGHKYKIVSCDEYSSTIIDKDGAPSIISNEMIPHLFQPQYLFRQNRIDSILSHENKED